MPVLPNETPHERLTSPTSTSVTITSPIPLSETNQGVEPIRKKSVLIDDGTITVINAQESRIQTLKRKYSITSAKTKTTSNTSKSQSIVNVKSCCGTFAFNCMRIVSILGMFLIIASFLAIFITTIYNYDIVKWPLVEILQHYGNSYKYYNTMIMTEYIAVYGRNESYALEYYAAKKSLISTMNRLFSLVPSASLGNLTRDANEIPLFKLQEQVVEYVVAKNYSAALTAFYNPTHYNGMYTFLNTYVNFVGDIKNLSVIQLNAMETATTTDLTVIAVCLSVAIPLVVLIFIHAIKVEHDSAKKLEHAKAIMVIQTIADPFMRPLFGEYCKGDSLSNRFHFLEQVQIFKEHKKSLHSTIKSILEDMKNFSNERNNNSSLLNCSTANSPSQEDDEQSEILTFSSDLFSMNSFKLNDSEDRQAMEIYNQFLDTELARNHVKYSKHEEIKKEIERYQVKISTGDSEGDLTNIFDEAQIQIGKKLINCHETFKNSLNFPNQSKSDMLDSFRVEYLKLMKKVENPQKNSFRNIDQFK